MSQDEKLGITLRDYFAGQALVGLSLNWGDTPLDMRGINQATAARSAYSMADAMMAQRDGNSLLAAVQALGAMPEGYCFCSKDRIGDDSKVHEPECRDLRAAIAKAGGT